MENLKEVIDMCRTKMKEAFIADNDVTSEDCELYLLGLGVLQQLDIFVDEHEELKKKVLELEKSICKEKQS